MRFEFVSADRNMAALHIKIVQFRAVFERQIRVYMILICHARALLQINNHSDIPFYLHILMHTRCNFQTMNSHWEFRLGRCTHIISPL